MSIELDVWPVGAVERLRRAEQVLSRQGLPASAVRAVLLDLVQTYEDLTAEDSEGLVATVMPARAVDAGPAAPPRQALDVGVHPAPPAQRPELEGNERRYAEFAELASELVTSRRFDLSQHPAYQQAVSWLAGDVVTVPDTDRLWWDAMQLALEIMHFDRARARRLYEWILETIPTDPAYVQERLRQASEESPGETQARLPRATAKEAGAQGGGKIARNRPRLEAGLADLGYVSTPRNSAVLQHPSHSNRRIVIKQQVVRFERKDGRRWTGDHSRPWQLEQSFRISTQVDDALTVASMNLSR